MTKKQRHNQLTPLYSHQCWKTLTNYQFSGCNCKGEIRKWFNTLTPNSLKGDSLWRWIDIHEKDNTPIVLVADPLVFVLGKYSTVSCRTHVSQYLVKKHLHEQKRKQPPVCLDLPNCLKYPYRPSWSKLTWSPWLKYVVKENKFRYNVASEQAWPLTILETLKKGMGVKR